MMEPRAAEPRFVPLMTLSAWTGTPLEVGRVGPGRKLSVCYFEHGHFSGDRLRGRLLAGGGDWASFQDADTFDIDVRAMLQTDDGALINLRYEGCWHALAGALDRVFAPGGYAHYRLEDHVVRIAARFETDAEAYKWLNRIVAVGCGELLRDDGVRFTLFELK